MNLSGVRGRTHIQYDGTRPCFEQQAQGLLLRPISKVKLRGSSLVVDFQAASALDLIGLPVLSRQAPMEAAKALATDLPLDRGME